MSDAPARIVLLQVSCPGCKTQHSVEVSRDYLDKASQNDGDMVLHQFRRNMDDVTSRELMPVPILEWRTR